MPSQPRSRTPQNRRRPPNARTTPGGTAGQRSAPRPSPRPAPTAGTSSRTGPRANQRTAALPPASPLRERVAALSKPVLVRLSALPRVVVPLLMVALAAVGLFAPVPVAVVALLVLIVFVGWLAYLSWPLLSTGSRALRVMMLVLLIGYGVLRVTR